MLARAAHWVISDEGINAPLPDNKPALSQLAVLSNVSAADSTPHDPSNSDIIAQSATPFTDSINGDNIMPMLLGRHDLAALKETSAGIMDEVMTPDLKDLVLQGSKTGENTLTFDVRIVPEDMRSDLRYLFPILHTCSKQHGINWMLFPTINRLVQFMMFKIDDNKKKELLNKIERLFTIRGGEAAIYYDKKRGVYPQYRSAYKYLMLGLVKEHMHGQEVHMKHLYLGPQYATTSPFLDNRYTVPLVRAFCAHSLDRKPSGRDFLGNVRALVRLHDYMNKRDVYTISALGEVGHKFIQRLRAVPIDAPAQGDATHQQPGPSHAQRESGKRCRLDDRVVNHLRCDS